MAFARALIALGFALLSTVSGEIPSYIHTCKRNDPNLNQCIINSVEALRPKLKSGIPELEVPALEPLVLPDLVSQHGNSALKFVGTNFIISGASNYKIKDLKVDMAHLSFNIDVSFSKMIIDAVYEVIGKFLSLNVRGKGPVKVIADDIDGKAIVKGRKTKKDGKTRFSITAIDLKLNLKNYDVKLGKGFFKDPAIAVKNSNIRTSTAVVAAIRAASREIEKQGSFVPIKHLSHVARIRQLIIDCTNRRMLDDMMTIFTKQLNDKFGNFPTLLSLNRIGFDNFVADEAIGIAIHENKREIINLIVPRATTVVSGVLMDFANKITEHFTFEELFPEK